MLASETNGIPQSVSDLRSHIVREMMDIIKYNREVREELQGFIKVSEIAGQLSFNDDLRKGVGEVIAGALIHRLRQVGETLEQIWPHLETDDFTKQLAEHLSGNAQFAHRVAEAVIISKNDDEKDDERISFPSPKEILDAITDKVLRQNPALIEKVAESLAEKIAAKLAGQIIISLKPEAHP